MSIDQGLLSKILGSEIAGTKSQKYSWSIPVKDDIGRLARFRDSDETDWSYGLFTGLFDFDSKTMFGCQFSKSEPDEMFFICEVQEVVKSN